MHSSGDSRRKDIKIGGAKLTGVSLLRDVLSMRDYGADAILDFTDAGVACTSPETSAKIARIILSELANRGVDLIVAETGDGIMGEYGVANDPGRSANCRRGGRCTFFARTIRSAWRAR